MENSNEDILIKKYFDHELSKQEYKLFCRKLDINESFSEKFEKQLLIHESEEFVLNSMYDSENEWNKFESKTKGAVIKKLFSSYQKIAVVILLPLIITLSLIIIERGDSSSTVVQVQHGNKASIVLPDGTSVRLNSDTKLEYPVKWSGDIRYVKLDGEAYFQVTKSSKPFIVKTPKGFVQVLGTSFNVKSFSANNEMETVLVEGKVSVGYNGNSFKLKPNQRIVIDKRGKTIVNRVKVDKYICWKENVLKIKGETISEVLGKLERWYGVKVFTHNRGKIGGKRFTITIKSESLRETLNLMKNITPFKYKIEGSRVDVWF